MNPTRSETLATRPPFIRQTTNESRIEMARVPERSSSPLLRTPSLLPQDVYDSRDPSMDSNSDSTFPLRVPRNAAGGLAVPQPLQAAGHRVTDAVRGHWRELTVGGVLSGVVGWAIWATVRTNAIENIPYCIWDESQRPQR